MEKEITKEAPEIKPKKVAVKEPKIEIDKEIVAKVEAVSAKAELGDDDVPEIVKSTRYFEATGRRKTSNARVRISTQGDKEFIVNDKPYQKYFFTPELQQIADSAMRKMKCFDKFRIVAKIAGGGIHSQAEAVRHGTARALVEFNIDFKKRLRRAGFLTRDPRQRERKKFGLKRARKRGQWAKR